MLQIIDLENNQLFTQVSSEESAIVNGGGVLSFLTGSFLAIGTGAFNNPVVQTALLAFLVNPTIS